jgi:hypothetical protein
MSALEVCSELTAQRDTLAARVAELEALLHNPDENANERFERIGEMYYRDTGFLRPGKSEPAETGRESNSAENICRFDSWWTAKCRAALARGDAPAQ